MNVRSFVCLAIFAVATATSAVAQVYIPRPDARIAWIREKHIHYYKKKIEALGKDTLSATTVSRFSLDHRGILTERSTRTDTMGDSLEPTVTYSISRYDRKNRKIFESFRSSWSNDRSWSRYSFLDNPRTNSTTVLYRSSYHPKPQRFKLYYDAFGRMIGSSFGDRSIYDSLGRLVCRVDDDDSSVNYYGANGLVDSERYYKFEDDGGWHYFGGRRYVRNATQHRDSVFFWFTERGITHSQVSARDSVRREMLTYNLGGPSDTTRTKYDDRWRIVDAWDRGVHQHYEYPVDTDMHTLQLRYINGILGNREEELYE